MVFLLQLHQRYRFLNFQVTDTYTGLVAKPTQCCLHDCNYRGFHSMNISHISKLAQKPTIYSPGSASMWVDEYISAQLLQTHLSQDTDLASRKASTIMKTVDWILGKAGGDTLSILDLGCGPGLYSETMAELGHTVTGVDFSAGSIRHAKFSAKAKKLNISYRVQNYLELDDEAKYDLIILIFTDFGVLTPHERTRVLGNIYNSLKTGGKLILDVLNDDYPAPESEATSWEAHEAGFWRNAPHLVLSTTFYYEQEKVSLDQYIVIDESGDMETYRFWTKRFTKSEITSQLRSSGFQSIECHHGVIPDSELYRSDDVTFCVAVK